MDMESVAFDTGPDEIFLEETGRGAATGVGWGVVHVESCAAKGFWEIRAEFAGGRVTINLVVLVFEKLQSQGLVAFQKDVELLVCCLGGLDVVEVDYGVRHHVLISADMDDLRGKLRDETELVKLTGRSLFGFLGKGVDQRAVIGFYNEGAAIKHVAKEFDAGKDCEEFPIIGAVPGFSRAELPGKKTKRFPRFLYQLFQGGPYGAIGGVRGESKWCRRRQKGGGDSGRDARFTPYQC
ncbi:hypothetical protein ABEB36_003600 [Hypothenemus hampei]|uniref:Uncharacterized protein n=1 Tax=Hypothenemus hampei TaxID=57062 RepID=A0ABD1FCW1_HYPHA